MTGTSAEERAERRHAAHATAELQALKTAILSTVSHELRTPLTPIRAYAELLATRDLPPEQASRFAREIVRASDRLERRIDLMLTVAALDGGHLEVSIQPTDLATIVDGVLRDWRARVPGRALAGWVADRAPAVAADPLLLHKVLDELVDNAVRFTDGPVAVTAVPSDDRVWLTVRDAGSGIPRELLPTVADDFCQVDQSATREHDGLGLGLGLTARVTQRFGAVLRLDSSPRGTSARIGLRPADG